MRAATLPLAAKGMAMIVGSVVEWHNREEVESESKDEGIMTPQVSITLTQLTSLHSSFCRCLNNNKIIIISPSTSLSR